MHAFLFDHINMHFISSCSSVHLKEKKGAKTEPWGLQKGLSMVREGCLCFDVHGVIASKRRSPDNQVEVHAQGFNLSREDAVLTITT